jgi:hypothetical protein
MTRDRLSHRRLWPGLASIALLAAVGCSDVHYNPYVPNDGHRPVGKVVEDVPDAANDTVNDLDRRFENAYY